MRHTALAIMLLLSTQVPTLTAAQAPAPAKPVEQPAIVTILDKAIANLERELVPTAEAMPEDKYDFAPTAGEFKGVRTFALQVKHIAVNNYWMGCAILGERMLLGDDAANNGPAAIKTKAELVRFLKDSFTYVHKAIATINDQNVIAPVKAPWGATVTRLNMVMGIESHGFNHYGQLVEYLRMNGIIPPASRKQ